MPKCSQFFIFQSKGFNFALNQWLLNPFFCLSVVGKDYELAWSKSNC